MINKFLYSDINNDDNHAETYYDFFCFSSEIRYLRFGYYTSCPLCVLW